jgi:hypothetical protein
MKIIRTANLNIIRIAILGGEIDLMGNCSESDHSFTRHNDHLKIKGHLQWNRVREHIEFYIEAYGDYKFYFYGDWYKFKIPTYENLIRLTDRIFYHLVALELVEET